MNHRRSKHKNRSGVNHIRAMIGTRAGESKRVRGVRRSRAMVMVFQTAATLLAALVLVVLLRFAFICAFVDSDHFMISRVEVVTNGSLERAQVLATTGVREHMNSLKLDLARIETSALTLPQVESAQVERILPDALKITLRERVPVAWISCLPEKWRARTATSGLLVDCDGHLFRCETLAADLLGLPVIDLSESVGLKPGGELPPGNAHAALQLIVAMVDAADATLPRLTEVGVSNGYSLEVGLETGEKAWLSPDQPVADFFRLVDIIDHFNRSNQSVTFANLLPRKNIAVRLGPPGAKSAGQTPTVKTARAVQVAPPVPTANRPTPAVRAILNRR